MEMLEHVNKFHFSNERIATRQCGTLRLISRTQITSSHAYGFSPVRFRTDFKRAIQSSERIVERASKDSNTSADECRQNNQIRFKSRSKSVRQLRIFFCLFSFSVNFINSTRHFFLFSMSHCHCSYYVAKGGFARYLPTIVEHQPSSLYLYFHRIGVDVVVFLLLFSA